MRIGIDARFLGKENSGLGRYTKNLLDFLQRQDKKNYYFVFLRQKNFLKTSFKNKNFKKVFAEFIHYSLKEQLIFPIVLYRLRLNLIHFLHFNVPLFYFGPYIVTIHDLTKHSFLGLKTTTRFPLIYWLKQAAYYFIFWATIKKAQKIITPSEFVRNEIIKKYKIEKKKIKVINEAVDSTFFTLAKLDQKLAAKFFKKNKIKTPHLVYTGNLYLHKNVEIILEALKSFKNLYLIILCPRNIFSQRFSKIVKTHKLQNQVSIIFLPNDQEMKLVYQRTTALVQPSLSEGFGLTGLEAMATGLPVIAARASCLPEIYGNAAIYFDPKNKTDLVKKIKKILSFKKGERQKIVNKGLRQVKKYSWQKCALQTLKVYQQFPFRDRKPLDDPGD